MNNGNSTTSNRNSELEKELKYAQDTIEARQKWIGSLQEVVTNATQAQLKAEQELKEYLDEDNKELDQANKRIGELEAVVSSQAKELKELEKEKVEQDKLLKLLQQSMQDKRETIRSYCDSVKDLQQRLDRNTATLITSSEKLKELFTYICYNTDVDNLDEKDKEIWDISKYLNEADFFTEEYLTVLKVKADKFLADLSGSATALNTSQVESKE